MLNYLYFDNLAIIMTLLISVMGFIVWIFSINYLKGDPKRWYFLTLLPLLMASLITFVSSNNIILLISALFISNLLLSALLSYRWNWIQARNSGKITLLYLGLSTLVLSIALYFLSTEAGTVNIYKINQKNISSFIPALIAISALAQSAIFPFHKWLMSSLNAPTPASAIMHAGLINAGGFLIMRFYKIFSQHEDIMMGLFIFGAIASVISMLFMLLQTNIKSRLAASTSSQMAFMLLQCGLGLYSAALTHLCWHSFFKSYLFLSAGSAVKTKKTSQPKLRIINFILSIAIACVSVITFSLGKREFISFTDTRLVLSIVAFITAIQMSIDALVEQPHKNFLKVLLVTPALFGIYGFSISIIEHYFISVPIAIGPVHLFFGAIFFLTWLAQKTLVVKNDFITWIYVKCVNYSHPYPSTITSFRQDYKI